MPVPTVSFATRYLHTSAGVMVTASHNPSKYNGYNAAVICEHISNYRGKYGVYPSLFVNQESIESPLLEPDIMIHLGTVLGFGGATGVKMKEVWRVHPDGEVRDTFKKLTNVFEMQEAEFFESYCTMKEDSASDTCYCTEFQRVCRELEKKVPELPFSNPWLAQNTVKRLSSMKPMVIRLMSIMYTKA